MRRRSFFQGIAVGIGAMFAEPTAQIVPGARERRRGPDADQLDFQYVLGTGIAVIGFELLPGQLATLRLRARSGFAAMEIHSLDCYLLASSEPECAKASLQISQHLPEPGEIRVESIVDARGVEMIAEGRDLGELSARDMLRGLDPGVATVEEGPSLRLRASASNRSYTEAMLVVRSQLLEVCEVKWDPYELALQRQHNTFGRPAGLLDEPPPRHST